MELENRRKTTPISNLEIAQPGFSNGLSTQIKQLIENGENRSLNQEEKEKIISEASVHYGAFLSALGVDWEKDPNSMDTPKRVAKAYVNDLWKGRYEIIDSDTTNFPADGYAGIILEKDIPLISQCSHHHQTILGKCHIAYVPTKEDGRVVGLSKLNRIVEHFSRRGAIQEQLTMAIHSAINTITGKNDGVMVIIHATHNCVSCRGVKHMGASMITSEVSGVFAEHNKTAKNEVMHMIGYNLEAYK
jgi:GTP cyclohydrolase IA